MIKQIIKLLLKYPMKIANRIYVNKFYINTSKRKKYETKNIIESSDNVLVFSPHVDDETIGLGATLIRSKESGAQMSLIYMADGVGSTSNLSKERLIDERRKEGYLVKESYDFKNIYFLDEPDGEVNSNKEKLIYRILDILNKENPTLVFTPFLIDGHTDHVETTKAVIKALERWNGNFEGIYMYEVNSAIDPELITNLTYMDNGLYNQKRNMYNIFKSQWAMGFDAFSLMDRGKRFLAKDEKIYAAEGFVKMNVKTSKTISKSLESLDFKPYEFKQLASDYNLILSFIVNKDKKEKFNNIVKDIMD